MTGVVVAASACIIGLALGFMLGLAYAEFSEARHSEAQRARRRALLGLPDRPPARRTARGSARVHSAEFRPVRIDPDTEM